MAGLLKTMLLSSWVLLVCQIAAWASVDGQTFDVDVASTADGEYSAQIAFAADGSAVTVDREDDLPDLEGMYAGSGTWAVFVSAQLTATSGDPYSVQAYVVSVDFKQSSNPLLQLLFANTPAYLAGVGIGTGFDFLAFAGAEAP